MIEKIYIPTIKRSDIQITYDNLPKELQSKVVFVVDPNERNLYKYQCEYLEIPDEFVGSWTQLAQTRKFIHQHAKGKKYAMIDDDLVFIKRNRKYFTGISDMENSKRKATPSEILLMFDTASKWLDENDIGIVGLSDPSLPPSKKEFNNTVGIFGVYFIDGKKLLPFVDELDTSIRVSEDLLFLFECLSRGINTRVFNEFLYDNKSATKLLKGKRPIWEEFSSSNGISNFQTNEHVNAVKYIQQKYPEGLTVLFENGKWKFKKNWKKVYRPKINNDLTTYYD